MGARHSKRSVDITTTPKKVGEDGAVIQEGEEGKLEKIAEPDLKVTTNGTLHSEIEFAVSFKKFFSYASVHVFVLWSYSCCTIQPYHYGI